MSTLPGWANRIAGITVVLAGLAWDAPASASPSATVFGYLPYWELSQVAATPPRYECLTHIACFSVEVNADGTLGNLHGWPGSWASLIDAAHANGVKIVLVATNMNAGSVYTLITTPASKDRFFANIRDQVLAGHADGLNIDFEDDMSNSPPWRSYINAFLADLTAYMHAQVPGCEVSFASPVVNWWAGTWDFASLAASSDYLFVMGYDFYGSWSSTSGPSAPLTGGYFNITKSITVDYAAVDPGKIILGVPYYGNEWTTATADPYSSRLAWVRSVPFASEQSATYGLQWDSASQTPWYRWYDGKNWHQVWFDNAQSLGLKYDLAKSHNLRGVGMWGLGFDGGRTELWDLLQEKFGVKLAGDINGDGRVDVEDLLYLVDAFGSVTGDASYDTRCDFNSDGSIDVIDLLMMVENFGT